MNRKNIKDELMSLLLDIQGVTLEEFPAAFAKVEKLVYEIYDEKEEYRKCHEAELGVCFQHCEEVKDLQKKKEELEVKLAVYFDHSEEIKELQEQKEELKNLLIEINSEIVGKWCTNQDGKLDSRAIPTYARAIRFLAEYDLITIEDESGRRVIGHWSER